MCKTDVGLMCFEGACRCNRTSFWNNVQCAKKKTFTASCLFNDECEDFNLLACINGKCTCHSDHFWLHDHCGKYKKT
jgi:hypothetical protein